jgi:hypothetical protein
VEQFANNIRYVCKVAVVGPLSSLIEIPSEVILAVVSSLGNVGFDGVESRPEVVRWLNVFCILRQSVSICVGGRARCTYLLWRILYVRSGRLPLEIGPH